MGARARGRPDRRPRPYLAGQQPRTIRTQRITTIDVLRATSACARLALGSAVLIGLVACAGGEVPSGSGAPSAGGVETAAATPTPEPRTWAGYLESLASALRTDDPPEVTPIQTVAPEDRYPAAILPCLADQGFPTDAGGTRTFPNDQLEVFNLAVYTCEVQYPMEEKYLQPLS